jgi:hypothetical protein
MRSTLPNLRDGYDAHPISRLDLAASEITTVIWASGFEFDYSQVELPVVDGDGYPIQKLGRYGIRRPILSRHAAASQSKIGHPVRRRG